MDYHSINITEFPMNLSTGQRYTPQDFFNYVRKNFSNFTTGFTYYSTSEQSKWLSNSYLGAIMKFDIVEPTLGLTQDGSVVCSEAASNHWIFTTIESPWDFDHPVSGNRQFGLKPESDGTYTFYTRGVDRVAEFTDDFLGSLSWFQHPYEGGYDLWESVMDKVIGYVNNSPWNPGYAYKKSTISYRPNYQKVKDVLEGRLPVTALGCK